MRIPKTYKYKGKAMTARELSEICGVPKDTIQSRICSGWTVERAATQPVGVQVRKNPKRCCDEWGCDCFNCELPDCNDNRPVRKEEVVNVPEMVGKVMEYDDRTCRIYLNSRSYMR